MKQVIWFGLVFRRLQQFFFVSQLLNSRNKELLFVQEFQMLENFTE